MAPLQPVLILSPVRSFSTVIFCMLAQHKELYGLQELYLFTAPTIGEMLHRSADFWRAGVQRSPKMAGILFALAMMQEGNTGEPAILRAQQWLEEHRDWSGSKVFDYLRRLAQPRRCIEKSPRLTAERPCLSRLLEAYPEAQILHLTRHPESAMRSIEAFYDRVARKIPGSPLADPASRRQHALTTWSRCHQNILDLASRRAPSHYLRINGEALLAAPRSHLRSIATWLGISPDDDAVATMLQPEFSLYATAQEGKLTIGDDGFAANPILHSVDAPPPRLGPPPEWSFGAEEQERVAELAGKLGYSARGAAADGAGEAFLNQRH